MENHPLTPMADANLVRVLSHQTEGTVGLVPFTTVDQGAHAIRDAMTQLKERGRRYAIVDAITDAHLLSIGEAAASHALITGGSGCRDRPAGEFPPLAGLLSEAADPGVHCRRLDGACAVVAGSCSRATLAQLGYARKSPAGV